MTCWEEASPYGIAMLAVAHLGIRIFCDAAGTAGPHRTRLHVLLKLKSPLSARVEPPVGGRLDIEAELLARRR